MRGEELVFFGWPDLAGLMRGRAFPAADLDQRLETGIGWVPVAQAISPLSTLAPSPWGALGDVWLAPDMSAGARVDLWPEQPPFHAYICDGIAPDGTAWEACLRAFLRRALADLERTFGLRLMVAFEQEFYLVEGLERPGPNYSIIAHEQALGFGAVLIAALRAAGLEPENLRAGRRVRPIRSELPAGARPRCRRPGTHGARARARRRRARGIPRKLHADDRGTGLRQWRPTCTSACKT